MQVVDGSLFVLHSTHYTQKVLCMPIEKHTQKQGMSEWQHWNESENCNATLSSQNETLPRLWLQAK